LPSPTIPPGDGEDNQISGALVANVITAPPEEQVQKDIPDGSRAMFPAGDISKFTKITVPEGLGIRTGNVKVSLVIDNNGNFQQAVVIDKSLSDGDRSKYEQFAAEIFRLQKFIPAQNNDGSKPELSNLVVYINISEIKPEK